MWGMYEFPDRVGFTVIGELEDIAASYDFDTILVVQEDATGDLFAAHDSGCSCPSPFEGVTSKADLTPIKSSQELSTFIGQHDSTYSEQWPIKDRLALYRKVDAALREQKQQQNPIGAAKAASRVVG